MSNFAEILQAGDAITFLEAGIRSPYSGSWFIGLEKYQQKNFGRADVFWRRFDLFGGLQEYMFTNGVWSFDAKTDSISIIIVKEEYFYDNKGEDDDIQYLHNGHKSFTLTKASENEISSCYHEVDDDSEQINNDKNNLHVHLRRADPKSEKSSMATPPESLILVAGGTRDLNGINIGEFNSVEELKQFYVENGFD